MTNLIVHDLTPNYINCTYNIINDDGFTTSTDYIGPIDKIMKMLGFDDYDSFALYVEVM